MERSYEGEDVGKKNILICSTGLDILQSLGEFSCAACQTRVGKNSIWQRL